MAWIWGCSNDSGYTWIYSVSIPIVRLGIPWWYHWQGWITLHLRVPLSSSPFGNFLIQITWWIQNSNIQFHAQWHIETKVEWSNWFPQICQYDCNIFQHFQYDLIRNELKSHKKLTDLTDTKCCVVGNAAGARILSNLSAKTCGDVC